MYSIKQGRANSLVGGIFALLITPVPLIMGYVAHSMGASFIFPFVAGVISLIFFTSGAISLYNAFAHKRMSIIDVVGRHEEPDPLDGTVRGFHAKRRGPRSKAKIAFPPPASVRQKQTEKRAQRHCTECGEAITAEYKFCPGCGNDLRTK